MAAVVLSVILLAGVGTAGLLWWRAENALNRVDISVDEGEQAGGSGDDGSAGDGTGADGGVEPVEEVLHVLVAGSDSREVLTPEERAELGTGYVEGELTDTLMLLRIDPNDDAVALLSLPRDLLVTRCDDSRGRINGAYGIGERDGIGGAACLVRTVTDYTGIPIDHYVKVDFRGFVDIVDTLGGVTMHIDTPLRDRQAHLDLPAGCVTLDGAESLAFVRARHLDNDFGRIARQQRFIRELFDEMTSVGTLANIPRLFSLIDEVGQSVEVDTELSLQRMRRIAVTLRGVSSDQLVGHTVPGRVQEEGPAYIIPDEEAAEELFAAFLDGSLASAEPTTEAPSETAAPSTPPSTPVGQDPSPSPSATASPSPEPEFAGTAAGPEDC